MAGLHDSILDTIGQTPVVRLGPLAPPGVSVYVKLEAFNPLGSVKDRLALGVIEAAEASGALSPGQTVIEATSGNTGLGLAMVCARKGYPLVVTMAENFSVERRRMLRFLGAKVVLTPASEKGSGMLAKAVELAEANGWFLVRQFENEANPDIHSRTTAREILADFGGARLDWWVTGYGTGGTLKGVARVLRAERPELKIAVCEPDNSQLLGSGIPQPVAGSHPRFRPHLVQGWSPDFIPRIVQDAVALSLIDRVVPVGGSDSLRLARELATREGIFCGISGGATLAGALAIAGELPEGAAVLCMIPDTGERYLTTPLFEGIGVDMDDDELALSRSTPSCRFDAAAPAPPSPARSGAPEPVAAPAAAARELDALLADEREPVVMFALEWCEFCWAVRRMFAAFGVPYRSVDLDSVAYQRDDRGGKLRAALKARTGLVTIPQVFVGGELVGGSVETLEAWRDGRLQALLAKHGVVHGDAGGADPMAFLPAWLQPRRTPPAA